MNPLRSLVISISIVFVFGIFGCAPRAPKETDEMVSRPLHYSGYSMAEYEGVKKISRYVEMSDGVKLAVDIFLPADGPDRDSYPVVFQMLPYTRAFAFPKMSLKNKIKIRAFLGKSTPILDSYTRAPDVRLLVSHGYAYIIADMRGTGASSGTAFHPIPENFDDTRDMLDWIASQSWCDGNIGMYGGSYLGYIQLVAASHKNPALKCIVPTVAPTGYADLAAPGGIYSQGFLKEWSDNIKPLNENWFIPHKVGHRPFTLPAMPAYDEDGDGEYIDEIPEYGDNETFLDGPPVYKDGVKREKNVYYNATMEHKKNVTFYEWAGDLRYIDDRFPPPYENMDMSNLMAHTFVKRIMDSGIAVYNVGGWHDANVRSTTEMFATMRGTNPTKMTIIPGYHTGRGPYWKYCGENEKFLYHAYGREMMRFFDKYLKGVENGIDTEPPVFIYVQKKGGGQWRFEREWPLAREVRKNFFFGDSNTILASPTGDGSDDYKADYTHDSRYGETLGNRYLSAAGVVPDELPVRNEKDKKLLTYTSAPMEEDMEVTGYPIVTLWVSSTADYGDFFVYLEDVNPDGTVVLVTEGQLRAGFAELHDNDLMGKAGVDIKPELPWHGYRKQDYKDKIFADGTVVKLVFDLMPTSWVFPKGHSIRVAIACADWPTFRLHEKLCPNNKPDDPENIVPTITVYRREGQRSHIELPVIPK